MGNNLFGNTRFKLRSAERNAVDDPPPHVPRALLLFIYTSMLLYMCVLLNAKPHWSLPHASIYKHNDTPTHCDCDDGIPKHTTNIP